MDKLTDRQVEVMELASQGMTNRQIAVALGLKEQTVKNCMSKVFDRLGVVNRVTAVLAYTREN